MARGNAGKSGREKGKLTGPRVRAIGGKAIGGFLRPFGCGWFIREFLLGNGPEGSPRIDPTVGSTQSDIFYHYKTALMRATATDRGTAEEERISKREERNFDPSRAEDQAKYYLSKLRYRSKGARYHSFVVYFSNLRRLGWVEATGEEEPSQFQENYPPGPPRIYYRLTATGRSTSPSTWRDPLKTLYPGTKVNKAVTAA
ncbi:MAG: hypothetical protein PHV74_09255 [Dehalococcoidia bacterium]|nr:hypothetical protein [Dehalococcoidia bacterium]